MSASKTEDAATFAQPTPCLSSVCKPAGLDRDAAEGFAEPITSQSDSQTSYSDHPKVLNLSIEKSNV